jgi:thiamine biosynthesis lipoprotein
MRGRGWLFWCVGLLSLLAGCAESEQPGFALQGDTMGTRYHIAVVADYSPEHQARLQRTVDEQLQLINQQMSTYLADSELSRLNRSPVGEPRPVSDALFEVLTVALEISWLSGGAFDMTVGELVDLWGFGPTQRPQHTPEQGAISAALARSGYQQVSLNLGDNSVTRQQPVGIDLSAIAKGFAVDRIATLLQALGATDYMVEIGGEIRVSGRNRRNAPWQIAIEQPGNERGINRIVGLTAGAVATSGDYRNYFEQDGVRYSHTIDPRTGYPVTHTLASVTVIADSAAFADGMATALSVLGPESGMAMAQEQGLAVYMLVKTAEGFVSRHSDAFARYLQ